MKRFIVQTIGDAFRPMLKGTRLMQNMDGIRLLKSHDVVPARQHPLGSGSFCRVTRVTLRGDTQDKGYACKQLKAELEPCEFFKAATELAYEAHILSCFDHPNVIKLRGMAADGIRSFGNSIDDQANGSLNQIVSSGAHALAPPATTFFLITDVLQETLDKRIERWKTVSRPQSIIQSHRRILEKVSLCKQLASALEYIHSKGVVYRDLKPQNVGFCEEDGNLKLFDLGLCRELRSTIAEIDSTSTASKRSLSEHTRFHLSGMVGTIRYMAPEVCLSRPYNQDCDIYSWSILAWEILSQAKPFLSFTPALYVDLVCKQGIRPTDLVKNKKPRGLIGNEHQIDNLSEYTDATTTIPLELEVLLKQAWNPEPHLRIRWSKIQSQLSLFEKIEELRLEKEQRRIIDDMSGGMDGSTFPGVASNYASTRSLNTIPLLRPSALGLHGFANGMGESVALHPNMHIGGEHAEHHVGRTNFPDYAVRDDPASRTSSDPYFLPVHLSLCSMKPLTPTAEIAHTVSRQDLDLCTYLRGHRVSNSKRGTLGANCSW